jgi:hypothetical protein
MARTYKEQWEAIGDVNGRRSTTCMGSQGIMKDMMRSMVGEMVATALYD